MVSSEHLSRPTVLALQGTGQPRKCPEQPARPLHATHVALPANPQLASTVPSIVAAAREQWVAESAWGVARIINVLEQTLWVFFFFFCAVAGTDGRD